MAKRIIVHYVVEAVHDFVYGRLRNEQAIIAVKYIRETLERVAKNDDPNATHVIVFQRDKHPSTEEEYLQTAEGKEFPYFHCPEGDPGMEVVSDLEHLQEHAFDIVDKPYIFDPATVCTLWAIEATYGHIDEVIFYGFLTEMCVLGAAVQARANFHDAEIKVDALGTAGLTPERHQQGLDVMGYNFIRVINRDKAYTYDEATATGKIVDLAT